MQTVEKIVCQGDPWGSIECGLMVDGFGKDSLKPELEPYNYKDKVPVPLLGMVDDTLLISECGYKTYRMNAFINAKTALKRLQFGPDKCHVMYVGKNIPEHKKMDLYVDGWKVQETKDVETGATTTQDIFEGEEDIMETNLEKYLGQVICSDGTNVKNVENHAGKGIGMGNTIESILKYVPGGKFHFEIAVLMRIAYLISSMLSCSEVCYNISESDLRKLEQSDESLMRKILNCSSQVSGEILSLELGLLPVRHIIKLRRMIYLQHILKQRKKNTLLYRFFIAQLEAPKRND